MTGGTVDPLTAILATNHATCMEMLNRTVHTLAPGEFISDQTVTKSIESYQCE